MGTGEGDAGDGVVNPRLSDVFGLVIRQDEVDFVIPHLREDLPHSLPVLGLPVLGPAPGAFLVRPVPAGGERGAGSLARSDLMR
ncbi:hypothetical protein GCM10010531_37420 [Blastococcus jejuensis]|uniref:Uncharacterized protein n=1 Tax=Blastococcus jejuensis TaxID=351224 RepID=A0ABP6PIW2_9ACTN